VIGVAGGSGSGKTTVVRAILKALGPERVALLEQDAYYRHRPELSREERARLNYDHPDSLDEALFVEHLRDLRAGTAVRTPVYDFAAHCRLPETRLVEPRPSIVAEGILLLASAAVRRELSLKLFVDTDADVRLIRRLRRDTAERGRNVESVLKQWEETVRPMHLAFVEPSRRHADLIIPEGENPAALEVIVARLLAHARQ
jgi:uridine kinase